MKKWQWAIFLMVKQLSNCRIHTYLQMMLEFYPNGTAYQTDAGMCGDYNSVIGMDKNNSLNRFLKKRSRKTFSFKWKIFYLWSYSRLRSQKWFS